MVKVLRIEKGDDRLHVNVTLSVDVDGLQAFITNAEIRERLAAVTQPAKMLSSFLGKSVSIPDMGK